MRLPKIFNGKDKLFFMGNYESYRKRGNTTGLYSLAPAAVQGGDFSGIASRIYDPTRHALAADGKTITGDAVPGQHHSAEPDQPDLEKAAGVLPHADAARRRSTTTSRRWRVRRIAISLSCAWITWSRRNPPGPAGIAGAMKTSRAPGLNLNGTKLVTNLEQYMGSNTRVFSPTVVTETRFGYTRFYNSVGTLLAFQRNVVDELGIPGLKGGDPVSWGIPEHRHRQLQRHRRQHRRAV